MGTRDSQHIDDKLFEYQERLLGPEEIALIDSHCELCPECRKKVRQHADTIKLLKDKNARIFCPDPVELQIHSESNETDEAMEAHLKNCPFCREEITIMRQSLQNVCAFESLPAKIRTSFGRNYGARIKLWTRIEDGMRSIAEMLTKRPLVSFGIAAAAVLAVIVIGHLNTSTMQFMTSKIAWNLPEYGEAVPKSLIVQPKPKIGIIIETNISWSQSEIDQLYKDITPDTKLLKSYIFMQPEEMAQVLSVDMKNSPNTKNLIHRLGISYILRFTLIAKDTMINVRTDLVNEHGNIITSKSNDTQPNNLGSLLLENMHFMLLNPVRR